MLRHIGIRISYFRRLKSWRQIDLAEKAGLSVSYIARIEAGINCEGIPISTYILLADTLGISLKKLVNIK